MQLIKVVVKMRQNRMISPQCRNLIIPAIPTISEHNKQVLLSGSVFGQNKTQTRSIDLKETSYSQLLKVKSTELNMNSNFDIKKKRPASVPLNESNLKTLIMPKRLRRKSETDIFILSPYRLSKIYPMIDIQNREVYSEKVTNLDNSLHQNKNRIRVASSNNLKTNKNYPVNFIKAANSKFDFITSVETANALLLGSENCESQSQINDLHNEASRSKEHIREQVQVIESNRNDILELKERLSYKYLLQAALLMLVSVIF